MLVKYNLHILNMRGQWYDGASNMCGRWNGLQVLFLKDCPYTYYVYCFARRLQLTLVATTENEISIWFLFFKNNNHYQSFYRSFISATRIGDSLPTLSL